MSKILTEADIIKFRKLSIIACGGNESIADEVLSITLEKFTNTIINKGRFEEINSLDDYIFRSLRNNYIKEVTKAGRERNKVSSYNSDNSDLLDFDNYIDDLEIEDHLKDNNEIEEKLNHILDCYNSMDPIEQKLFYARYIVGISGREIGRRIGFNKSYINSKLKKLREDIKDDYEKRNNL